MNIEIHTTSQELTIAGLGSLALNKDYVTTVFKLSGKVWEILKAKELKNKGQNIWVYENNDRVFAGVETEDAESAINHGLEIKKIILRKYAWYKHTGSYNGIKKAGQLMTEELRKKGFEIIPPYIEIYGHWNKDETKLETELLMCLQ